MDRQPIPSYNSRLEAHFHHHWRLHRRCQHNRPSKQKIKERTVHRSSYRHPHLNLLLFLRQPKLFKRRHLQLQHHLGPIRGQFLQTPQGTTEFVGCILFGIIVHYFQSRLFMSLVAQLIGFMATCLLTSGTPTPSTPSFS